MHKLGLAAFNNLVKMVDEAIKETTDKIKSDRNSGFSSWLEKALGNGAGLAHRFTHQTPKAPPLPEVIHTKDGILTRPAEMCVYYRHMWEQQWGKLQEEIGDMYKSLRELISRARYSDLGQQQDPITAADVVQGCSQTARVRAVPPCVRRVPRKRVMRFRCPPVPLALRRRDGVGR